jgi:HNH endonuclease
MLTARQLRELLDYDPRTGIFRWRINKVGPGAKKDKVAGVTRRPRGNRSIKIDGCSYLSARLAFLWMLGRFPEHQVDHRNRIPSDDRWSNLREATNSQNGANKPKRTNGLKGVYWHKASRKYRAVICVDSRHIHLGVFDREEVAHAAYGTAARKYFGNFACLDSAISS